MDRRCCNPACSGRLFFSETGVGNTNVAVLGGVPVYAGLHHAYDGNFSDSSSAGNPGNPGIAAGGASITTAAWPNRVSAELP